MRLNRYLASCGLGSRRGVEEVILSGKVKINGTVVTSLSTQVNPGDEVMVGGRKSAPLKTVVIALHKPKGFVCSREDDRERRTIYDLLPKEFGSLHHVGRLDMDSSGLILLTNQGDLSHRLTHPSKGVEKEYEVTVEEKIDEQIIPKLIKGMMTPEGYAKAERAWLIGNYKVGMVLKQGLKRQIRHMLYYCGNEVRKLVRVRIGGLFLKGMREGGWIEVPQREVDRLMEAAESGQAPRPRKPGSRKPKPESTDKKPAGEAPIRRKRAARKTSRRPVRRD